MIPIDINGLQCDLDRFIANKPKSRDLDEICSGDGIHGSTCKDIMEFTGKKCLQVRIDQAIKREARLAVLHWLRDSAREPWNANGLETLKGMASASPILETRSVSLSSRYKSSSP